MCFRALLKGVLDSEPAGKGNAPAGSEALSSDFILQQSAQIIPLFSQ
jgi:hypothetical protein